MKRARSPWVSSLLLLAVLWILVGSIAEFYQIAWGTGVWLGQFAPSWFVRLVLFCIFCIALSGGTALLLWQPQKLERVSVSLQAARNQLGIFRWLAFALLLFIPVYFLQYTFWGIVLHGIYLRILLVTLCCIFGAWLIAKSDTGFTTWPALLVALVSMAGVLTLFAPLGRVTDYPFSLAWSEGNRLWDYSVLFGRDVYIYPAEKSIPVFLDTSRQFVGGIPFLLPGVTIAQVRLWLALVDIVPYLILGWIAFRLAGRDSLPWLLAGVWAFTFVRQGPIHAPLLICAIVVALAWGRPLWLAAPLIFAAGYFAEASRFTWLFAPAMWSVMLEFASAPVLAKNVWKRAAAVGSAGIFGGYIAPFYLPALLRWIRSLGQQSTPGAGPIRPGTGVTLSTVESGLSSQPLLWDRLLPNETYGLGILFGLILAVLPLILILFYLAKTRRWNLNPWQQISIVLPLLAFLVVGLIVSVKIGGGGDLHNLDMFIIGLMFAAAIAWRNGGYDWIRSGLPGPSWVTAALIAMLLLPAYQPLRTMRPLSVDADLKLVVTLADITPNDPLPDPLPDTIPSEEDTQQALEKLQNAVQAAASSGEILFMDQRQLLTFGYIEDVPLVPQYDKKLLIDEAMAGNALYFEKFYQDLSAHRFALIITNPVNRRLDREEGHFSEENNAWVKWVTRPLLCYYQPLDVLKKVDVELLVPRTDIAGCENELP